jgi:predicted transcriptional regulator of viral defense system
MHSSRNTNQVSQLLSQDKRYFYTYELATLWGVTNQNTLYSTIQRYLARGILHRLGHGVYSCVRPTKLHEFEIGCALAGPLSYVSGETILSIEGAIMQQPTKITLFGSKTQEFEMGDNYYLCRYLNPKYLVNRAGIMFRDGYFVASPTRALSDLKHSNPIMYLDNPQVIKYQNEDDPYAPATT